MTEPNRRKVFCETAKIVVETNLLTDKIGFKIRFIETVIDTWIEPRNVILSVFEPVASHICELF
jgi:hypothetical protein